MQTAVENNQLMASIGGLCAYPAGALAEPRGKHLIWDSRAEIAPKMAISEFVGAMCREASMAGIGSGSKHVVGNRTILQFDHDSQAGFVAKSADLILAFEKIVPPRLDDYKWELNPNATLTKSPHFSLADFYDSRLHPQTSSVPIFDLVLSRKNTTNAAQPAGLHLVATPFEQWGEPSSHQLGGIVNAALSYLADIVDGLSRAVVMIDSPALRSTSESLCNIHIILPGTHHQVPNFRSPWA